MIKQRRKYSIKLPEDLPIRGYNQLNVAGESLAFSPRQAVTYLIALQNPNLVGLIMDELDENYGGAESYVSIKSLPSGRVYQTKDDLAYGEELTESDRSLLEDHVQAYALALEAKADLKDPKTKFKYLDIIYNSRIH